MAVRGKNRSFNGSKSGLKFKVINFLHCATKIREGLGTLLANRCLAITAFMTF